MGIFFIFLVNYLIGSISFAVIISRLYGVDILSVGSRNPGATNVKRSVGKTAGRIVFTLDFLKGFLGALWPLILFYGNFMAVIGAVGIIVGHNYSIFLRFRGGKGVSATMGSLLALMPGILLIGAIIWWLAWKLTRYVSVASMAFGVTLPICCFIFRKGWDVFFFACFVATMLIMRHRPNIKRLLEGSEHKS
jgi:acyl phosphate:glycerol-3-phosphate acyltransferase